MQTYEIEAQRIESMLELAGVFDQKYDYLEKLFQQIGIDRTIEKLNLTHDTNLRLGDYVIISNQEKGFWSNDYGWCLHKNGATGYSTEDLEAYRDKNGKIKPTFIGIDDAEFILYEKTKDFTN